MAYASFILGTRMLYQYEYKPMSTQLWDSTKTLTSDLEAVFARTVSANAHEVAQKTSGDFLYSLRKTDGGYLLVIANSGDKPVSGRIMLGAMPEQVEASKCVPYIGTGKLSLGNGFINVSLKGLDCGAYILK
jgi:hypothetical protein